MKSETTTESPLEIGEINITITMNGLTKPEDPKETVELQDLGQRDVKTGDSIETTDDLLFLCGDSGRWQIRTFFLAFLAGFPAALQDFLYVFIAATPEHYWCKVPECPGISYDTLKNLTIPSEISHGHLKFQKCSRYSSNFTGDPFSSQTCDRWMTQLGPNTESCKEFDYDHSVFESTIVTEWHLVCGEEFWTSSSQAVYAAGSLTGSLIFGIVSDNYGRKRAIVLSLIISILFGPAVAFAPNYTLFLVARYLLAIGSPGIFDITFILVMEMIGGKWRGAAGNLFPIPYALGYSGTAVIAYFFRHWRDLQLRLTVFPLLFLGIMYFVPESPRWLINKGRVKEAEEIIINIAKTNQRLGNLPPNLPKILENLADKPPKTGKNTGWRESCFSFFLTFSHLFRTPKMRRRTIVLNICWLSTVLVYFGVALNAPNLSANQYIYTLVSGLLEIPSYFFAATLIRIFGRRIPFAFFLFVCGCSLCSTLFCEQGSTAIIVLALVGMFHIASSYALIFVYGIELMPTSLRTYGIGSAAITGKIGNAGAPYVTTLLGNMNKQLPTIIFAGFSFLASFLSLLLPETKDKQLPETVDDVEKSE